MQYVISPARPFMFSNLDDDIVLVRPHVGNSKLRHSANLFAVYMQYGTLNTKKERLAKENRVSSGESRMTNENSKAITHKSFRTD
jgi:hypothetical protein